MFRDEKDRLYLLIKSLNKAEKRNFKLFSNRIKHDNEMKFVVLFDVLDHMPSYDESKILKKMSGISSTKLQNIKRHLYRQILKSLRLIYQKKEIEIQIREELDYANILYGKGLFLNSLRILDRVKKMAKSHHQQLLLMEIIEFEKRIEGRHITRSRKVKQRMEHLIQDAQELTELNNRIATLSNLALKIHGYFIKNGHVKNEDDYNMIYNLYHGEIDRYQEPHLTPPELVSWHQSKLWYYYIRLEFDKCLNQALYWVDVFERYPNMIKTDVALYLRGLHYSLNMYFYLGQYEKYNLYLQKMESFYANNKLDFNFTDQMMYFIYHSNALLNNFLLCGQFAAGLKYKSSILDEIEIYNVYLDRHRSSVLKYKLSWMHFGIGELEEAMVLLNEIINEGGSRLSEDVLYYAKLMQLMIHLKWEHKYLLDSLITSIKRMTNKMANRSNLHLEILKYLNKIKNISSNEDITEHAITFKSWMDTWFQNRYERRVLAYFDFYAWIESHINNTSIEQEVQLRHLEGKGIMLL